MGTYQYGIKFNIYNYSTEDLTEVMLSGEIRFFNTINTSLVNQPLSIMGDGSSQINALPFREIMMFETSSNLSLVSYRIQGNRVEIKNTGSADITVNIGTSGSASYIYLAAGQMINLSFDGTNWIQLETEKTGVIKMWAGDTTMPTGYLLCNGQAVSRTTYAKLFVVCGTTYGTGDGSTTFNVPDFGGIFPRGAGTSTKLTNANGAAFAGTRGTYQNDKFQGFYMGSGGNAAGTDSAVGSGSVSAVRLPASTKLVPMTDGTNGTPRTGTETNPANVAIYFIIKT